MRVKKYSVVSTATLTILLCCATPNAFAESKSYSTLQSTYGSSPENVKNARAYAKSAISWGKYDTAKEVYQQLLDSSSPKVVAKQAQISMDLAKVHLSLNDFESAQKVLKAVDQSEISKKDAKKIKKLLKKIKKKTKPNKFGASLAIAATTTDNIAKTSSGFDSFEEIESDDFDDEGADSDDDFGSDFDDDFLADLEEDIEIDDEDLSDQLVEDLDGDGIDDDFDQDVDAVDEDGDGEADEDEETAADDADGDEVDDAADADSDDSTDETADATADEATDDAATADDAAQEVEAAQVATAKAGKAASKKKTKKSDMRYAAKLGAQHSYLLNPRGHFWNSAVSLSGSINQDQKNADRATVLVGTGPVFNVPSMRLKINPSINYLYLNKDSKDINESIVPSLATTFKASPTLTLAARYNYETRDFYEETSPDVDIDTFKVGAKYKITKKDVVGISYSPKIEDSSKATKSKDQHGFGASYTHEFPLKIFTTLKADYKEIEFKNAEPVKEDEEQSYSLVVGKKFGKNFSVFLGGNTKDRESNIAGKSSYVKSFVFGAGYKF